MTAGRKLYYAPGMISVIGMLTFLIWSLSKFEPKQYGLLPFNVPTEDKNSPYSIYQIEERIKMKKQIQLTLDADDETNEKKMEIIKYEARKLKYTQDTSAVLRVRFTDDITYGLLVRLIDLCHVDGHKRFVLLKNSFVIFGEYPAARNTCNSFSIKNEGAYNKKNGSEKTFIDRLSNFVQPLSLLQFFGLLLLWFTLILIFLFRRKK